MPKYLFDYICSYKFRYEKNEHKCDKVIEWLKNNIPEKITKQKLTKFKLTENANYVIVVN